MFHQTMFRRKFITRLGAALVASELLGSLAVRASTAIKRISRRYLRPPGSLVEKEFLETCIRCGQCAEVCPNQCIKFFDMENGFASRDTPYIVPREKACILCMKCGDICPSGAIQPIKRDAGEILAKVDMGQARVDKQLCLSYQGKTCGVCYRACPLPDIAISVGLLEQPSVSEYCVGCGLCARSCIQIPQAIKVVPRMLLGDADSKRVAT